MTVLYVSDAEIEHAKRVSLLRLLPGDAKVKPRQGSTYMTTCTMHDDKSPSMGLKKYDDGCWRYRCFGCGASGDPINYIEITKGMTFMEAVKHLNDQSALAPVKPMVTDTYRYLDETGQLLYEVLRYSPKGFRQRRPGENGQGWCWSVQGLRKVLYRLPKLQLNRNSNDTVWYVEGEKDVHTLEGQGLLATTHAGGSNSWRSELVQHLKGFRVIVVPDKDEPGMQLMRRIWNDCLNAKIDVGFALLPDGRGKDVTEFFEEHNGTVDELRSLIK